MLSPEVDSQRQPASVAPVWRPDDSTPDIAELRGRSSLNAHRLLKAPASIFYIPNYVTAEESSYLLAKVASAPLPKWTHLRNRRLQNWGATPTGPKGTAIHDELPPWLEDLGRRISDLAVFEFGSEGEVERRMPNHVLVNEYRVGQGIMPHEDGPAYFPAVATVSLGGHTRLDFYKKDADRSRKEFSLILMPGSLLVLRDDAYEMYLHGIDETSTDVFRTSEIANLAEAGLGSTDEELLNREERSMTRLETRISLTFRAVKRVSKVNLMSALLGKQRQR